MNMKQILHGASEKAPYNELILVIYAKKGYEHNHASTYIAKGARGKKFTPANLKSEDKSILPIAWCLASDVYKLIGLDKVDKEALFERSKREAWSWYKEESKIQD